MLALLVMRLVYICIVHPRLCPAIFFCPEKKEPVQKSQNGRISGREPGREKPVIPSEREVERD
jgi:hypothetical protein